MRDFDIIAVDIESSGDNPDKHALISIGCVRLSDFSTFYTEIRHEELICTPEAFRIHDLDIRAIDNKIFPTPVQTDISLRTWLKSDKFYSEGKNYSLIPMGFNVGAFDMQFIKNWLPKSYALFGRRSMDLNALLFDEAVKRGETFYEVKKRAKNLGHSFAISHFGDKREHHALYDSWVGLGVYHYLHGAESSTVGEVSWEGGRNV